MPYLTTTGQRLSATEYGEVGLGVPGYAHPLLAPAEWAGLTRPATPLHWVVLNVAQGPGVRPDPHCLDAAGRLTNAGVRVLGHLDLAYGSRPFGEIVAEAQRYLDWYRVAGFSLDRCPADRADLPAVRRITATLETLVDGAHVVLGHGTHPYPGYAEAADQLVTFSGPWSDYRWSQAAEWTAKLSAGTVRPPRPRTAPHPPGRGDARRPLAGRGNDLLHRPDGPAEPVRGAARLLGRNRLAGRTWCLGMRRAVALLQREQITE